MDQSKYLGTGSTRVSGRWLSFHWVLCSFSAAFSAARTVFFISMATVIGPTPPGTGVIHPAFFLASSKSTSPTSREPDFFVASTLTILSQTEQQNTMECMRYPEWHWFRSQWRRLLAWSSRPWHNWHDRYRRLKCRQWPPGTQLRSQWLCDKVLIKYSA